MKGRHIAVLFAIIAVVGLLFTSCIRINNRNVSIGKSVYRYDDGKKYSVGDGEVPASKVSEMEIDWVSGEVSVVYGNVSSINFTESYRGSLSEDQLLHWYLDGSTLRLKYQKSGVVRGKSEEKNLVVTVPKGTVLSDLDLDCVSSNFEVDVDALKYDVDTVSGNVNLSSSGARAIDVDSVSGNVNLHLLSCPAEIDVDTVSGSVNLWIPADSGFTAEISSVSGKLNTAIPVTTSGKKYIAGDGRAKFSLESVSGDLNINSN